MDEEYDLYAYNITCIPNFLVDVKDFEFSVRKVNTNFDPDIFAKHDKLQLYFYDSTVFAGANYNTSWSISTVESNTVNEFRNDFFRSNSA